VSVAATVGRQSSEGVWPHTLGAFCPRDPGANFPDRFDDHANDVRPAVRSATTGGLRPLLVLIALFFAAALGGAPLCEADEPSHLRTAAKCFRHGEFAKAESEIQQVLRSDPQSGEAYNLLGEIRVQQGRLLEAELSFLKAVQLTPRLADAYENLAVLELLRHRNREAKLAAEKLLQLDPNSYNGRLVSGIVDYSDGHYRLSLKQLEPLTKSEADPIVLAISAEAYRRLGRLEEADKLKRDLEGIPVPAKDALLAARLLSSEELQPYLVQRLQKAGSQGAQTFQVLYELGNAYFRMKQFDLAEKQYLQILSKKPSDPNVLLRLFAARESLGDSQMALRYLYQAKQTPKTSFPTLMHYSLVCIERHMLLDAQKALLQALDLQPGDVSAQYTLGITAFSLGNFCMAEQQFRSVLSKVPTHAEACVSLGVVFLSTSRRAEAEEQFRQALKIDANLVAAHYYLAQIHRQTGKPAEARKELEEAIRLDPREARSYADLAGLQITEGRLDAASENLSAALGLDSKSAKAHYQLGILLRKQGKLRQAQQEFQLAQKLREQEEKNAVVLLISKESREYGEFLPSNR